MVKENLAQKIIFVLLSSLLAAGIAQAQVSSYEPEGAYLDPQYPARESVVSDRRALETIRKERPATSNILDVIAQQSSVRSQGARGTCSIFSATALLEGLLIKEFKVDQSVNLSEEWLQYITHINNTNTGSSSSSNFTAFSRYGTVSEETWPYVGQEWTELQFSTLSQQRCGHLMGLFQTLCLVAHKDTSLLNMAAPLLASLDMEFFNMRNEATAFKAEYLKSLNPTAVNYLSSEKQVKDLLSQNIPVTLDVDFYYGAWNHRKSTELGLTRNMENWGLGIVGYPEVGSLDREVSLQEPAGHSIVLVGYDDNATVKITTQMANGTLATNTYKGVYYFKNSWGTESFGINAKYKGTAIPGYGMITQKYAHEFGGFYRMPLVNKQ